MLQKRQLSNFIAEHIRAEILNGTYPPGRFLRLDEVAQELGVSATPIREAFVTLSVEGFVKHVERRGFRVASLERRDFEDVYSLLAQVAGRLAERAATAMTPVDIEKLAAIHERMENAVEHGDAAGVEQTNDLFHRTINRSAASSKLAWILLSMLKYVPKKSYASIPGLSAMLIEQHKHILTAIQTRDPTAANLAMCEHEEVSMSVVLEDLERRGVFDGAASTSLPGP